MKQIFSALVVIIMIISSKTSIAQSKNDLVFNDTSDAGDMSLESPDKNKSERKLTYVSFLSDLFLSGDSNDISPASEVSLNTRSFLLCAMEVFDEIIIMITTSAENICFIF